MVDGSLDGDPDGAQVGKFGFSVGSADGSPVGSIVG